MKESDKNNTPNNTRENTPVRKEPYPILPRLDMEDIFAHSSLNEQNYYAMRRDERLAHGIMFGEEQYIAPSPQQRDDNYWVDYVRDNDNSNKRVNYGSWSVFVDESKKSARHK